MTASKYVYFGLAILFFIAGVFCLYFGVFKPHYLTVLKKRRVIPDEESVCVRFFDKYPSGKRKHMASCAKLLLISVFISFIVIFVATLNKILNMPFNIVDFVGALAFYLFILGIATESAKGKYEKLIGAVSWAKEKISESVVNRERDACAREIEELITGWYTDWIYGKGTLFGELIVTYVGNEYLEKKIPAECSEQNRSRLLSLKHDIIIGQDAPTLTMLKDFFSIELIKTGVSFKIVFGMFSDIIAQSPRYDKNEHTRLAGIWEKLKDEELADAPPAPRPLSKNEMRTLLFKREAADASANE
ncbi:MAG: hypothetical protein FWC55_01805 [Firmicutes bacterium]|nr:hypothetical protein [Bacillota bacterium]